VAFLRLVYYRQMMYYVRSKSAAMAIPAVGWKNSSAATAEAEP